MLFSSSSVVVVVVNFPRARAYTRGQPRSIGEGVEDYRGWAGMYVCCVVAARLARLGWKVGVDYRVGGVASSECFCCWDGQTKDRLGSVLLDWVVDGGVSSTRRVRESGCGRRTGSVSIGGCQGSQFLPVFTLQVHLLLLVHSTQGGGGDLSRAHNGTAVRCPGRGLVRSVRHWSSASPLQFTMIL